MNYDTETKKNHTVKDVMTLRINTETIQFSQQKLYSPLIINKNLSRNSEFFQYPVCNRLLLVPAFRQSGMDSNGFLCTLD